MLRHRHQDLRVALLERSQRSTIDQHRRAAEIRTLDRNGGAARYRSSRRRNSIDPRLLSECRGADEDSGEGGSELERGEKNI
jgi:hypothetical protein